MRILLIASFALMLATGCASTGESGDPDAALTVDGGGGADGARDGAPLDGAPRDSAPVDACVLGTTASCGTCGTPCPGADNAGTLRRCTSATAAGTCDVTCAGEFYDLDGMLATGCEAEDAPAQDTATSAVDVTLPNATGGTGACNNAANPCTVAAQIHSDDRQHDVAPLSRTLGREDWFRVIAVGAGTANKMKACLNIGNYPADNTYEVCISDAGSAVPSTCGQATGGGGASACVNPPAMPDSGTFFVRIRKISGTRTTNKYALYLEH